ARTAAALLELEASKAREAALREANAQLQEANTRLKEELEAVRAELIAERAANAALREEVKQVKAELAKFEAMLKDLQDRYDILEKEANEMREELARRNNTKTRSCQTQVTGEDLDAQDAELKKLRVMLEELQQKVKDLLEQCKRKLGGKVQDIADALGLGEEFLGKKTVFQRLYDDAKDRVHRLEALREKVRQERGVLLGPEAAAEAPEPSVMSILEGEPRIPEAPQELKPPPVAVSPPPRPPGSSQLKPP
ncbi:unnamed protein product, partial [Polarella glacialis]